MMHHDAKVRAQKFHMWWTDYFARAVHVGAGDQRRIVG